MKGLCFSIVVLLYDYERYLDFATVRESIQLRTSFMGNVCTCSQYVGYWRDPSSLSNKGIERTDEVFSLALLHRSLSLH